ncbi:MAG: hypothetical protein ABI234_01250 [Ktedonobacteraceae bacterium]
MRETVFDQLTAMGAQIEREGDAAVVHGPARLVGRSVHAHDLWAGLALLLAGAAAEGKTIIENAEMIERGCSAVLHRFSQLGLTISEERL